MELRQLEYFIAVAEELHFGKAALRLQMTQPPLSQQIRQLEEEIGVTLFHRTKRHVELTAAGIVFLEETKIVLKKIKEAIESAQRIDRGQAGHLTIGSVASATYDLLPKVVRIFREQYPEVELVLRELVTQEQVEALYKSEIDVGVLRPPIVSKNLLSEVVQREECLVVLPQNHKLTRQPSILLSDLAPERFIMVRRSVWTGYYDQLLGLCRQVGFSPNIYQEATELLTVIGLVAAGIGIAVVPSSAENLNVRGVVYKKIRGISPTVEMAICWRKQDTSVIIKEFLQIVKNSADIL